MTEPPSWTKPVCYSLKRKPVFTVDIRVSFQADLSITPQASWKYFFSREAYGLVLRLINLMG